MEWSCPFGVRSSHFNYTSWRILLQAHPEVGLLLGDSNPLTARIMLSTTCKTVKRMNWVNPPTDSGSASVCLNTLSSISLCIFRTVTDLCVCFTLFKEVRQDTLDQTISFWNILPPKESSKAQKTCFLFPGHDNLFFDWFCAVCVFKSHSHLEAFQAETSQQQSLWLLRTSKKQGP